MGRGAVRSDNPISRRATVPNGRIPQCLIARLVGRIENQRDIHHDVDEQRLWTNKAAQVLTVFSETHGQRPTGLNQNLVQLFVVGQTVPRAIRVQEDEAQVMHVAIVLPVFQQPGIVFSLLPPNGIATSQMELPHHAGQKTAGPIGPQLALVTPAAIDRVDRKEVGMTLCQRGNLPLGEFQCLRVPLDAILVSYFWLDRHDVLDLEGLLNCKRSQPENRLPWETRTVTRNRSAHQSGTLSRHVCLTVHAIGAIHLSVSTPPILHVVLHQPDIPQNTGNVGRTCLAVGAHLWLVRPLGFQVDAKHLRRAGLDYWKHVPYRVVDHWDALQEQLAGRRFWFFSKKATRLFTDVSYSHGDVLVFGSETRGLPDSLLERYPDRAVRIPIGGPVRSLNLASSVAVAVYESLRQWNWQGEQDGDWSAERERDPSGGPP